MKKIIIFYLLFVTTIVLKAQTGTPDSTFGATGKVLSETYEGSGYSVAIQKDGKILVGGSGGWYGDDSSIISGFLLVRYNIDGSIDESFGDHGRAINDLGDQNAAKKILKIALQSDGKIVASGTYNAAIAVIRYNIDGTIDTQFGENGLAIYDESITMYHIMRDMTLLTDGRIIITGDIQKNDNDSRRSFILSYTSTGILDESFGDNGVVIINTVEVADIKSVIAKKDNKIIIAGQYFNYRKFILYQYNPDGSPDISFGENGFSYMDIDSDVYYQEVVDLILTIDDKITIIGRANTNSNNGYTSLITSRFISNGIPDSSYGANGYSLISLIKQSLYPQAAVINEQNNIIIAGGYLDGKINYSILMSLTERGLTDSSFGTNGISFTDLSANLQDVAIQTDGKIVVAGYFLYQNYPYYRYYYVIGRFEGYSVEKNKYVKIKKWLHRHGFTWQDWPGKNISYYAVQRSGNGNNFTEIARLFNRNNQQQFSYADAAPLTGDNFYRLAAVSADGAAAFSNVLAIPNNAATVKLYPNPAKNNLVIEGLPATEKTKLVITDLNGVARMSTVANSNAYNWNISGLKAGSYILRITNGSNVITKKFLKE